MLRSTLGLLLLLGGAAVAADDDAPRILSVKRIWDQAGHAAFPDLIRWQGQWLCVFREGDAHVPGVDGTIRVLGSADGESWKSLALLRENAIDLRDPKVSIAPDGRLVLLAGGSTYGGTPGAKNRPLVKFQTRVFFSSNARDWTAPHPILGEGQWLWRLTWHDGKAYGVAYGPRSGPSGITLYSSTDAREFTPITTLAIPGQPNETTLRFRPDGSAVALVRREAEGRKAWVGTAASPYSEWTWHETSQSIGGPNFLILPNGKMIAGGRQSTSGAKMVLGWLTPTSYTPCVTLPSGGDCSYPGLVYRDEKLWVIYYASHEGKTSIYLARLALDTARD